MVFAEAIFRYRRVENDFESPPPLTSEERARASGLFPAAPASNILV